VAVGVAIGAPVGVPIGFRSTVGRRDTLIPLRLRISNILPRHSCTHDGIPMNKEGLRKVLLDTDRLVVDVMVVGVVAEQELERVERKEYPQWSSTVLSVAKVKRRMSCRVDIPARARAMSAPSVSRRNPSIGWL
jgi:hypothetical protein